MTLVRINDFTAADDHEEALGDFLMALLPYISGSEGCLGVEFLRGEDEGSYVVLERWSSKEAHAASLKNYPPEKMQEGMSLIGAPPQGRWFSVD